MDHYRKRKRLRRIARNEDFSDTVSIFRIEEEDGTGPWSGMTNFRWLLKAQHKDLPSNPWSDPLLRKHFKSGEHRCGAKDYDQFLKWFPKEKWNTIPDSFGISRYEIPRRRVIVGTDQVIFSRKRAKPVERVPLSKAA